MHLTLSFGLLLAMAFIPAPACTCECTVDMPTNNRIPGSHMAAQPFLLDRVGLTFVADENVVLLEARLQISWALERTGLCFL